MTAELNHTILVEVTLTIEEACELQNALTYIKKGRPQIFTKLMDVLEEAEVC